MDENEFIEKIKVLNVKKGDVLVVKFKDEHPSNIPRHIVQKHLDRHIKAIHDFVTKNWKGQVGMIAVPKSMDFEVIRLEEWFV